MKPREQLMAENPLDAEWERRGWPIRGTNGKRTSSRCPEVEHQPQHQCVSIDTEKGVWHCHDCKKGGTVIDLTALADGIAIPAAMAKLDGETGFAKPAIAAPVRPASGPARIVGTYDYHDERGGLLFQVVRLEPKSFRQRHRVNGEWSWSMEGVRRVLYNLPAVLKAEFVWIVEGEKDADTLNRMGLAATCNPGGAGKWLDAYTASLKGKDVILCGDNDEPGKAHVAKVAAALAGTVKTTRTIELPAEFKDVSEYAATFGDPKECGMALVGLAEDAEALVGGVRVPVKNMGELEREYQEFAQSWHRLSMDLGAWLPALAGVVRPLVPGELVTIIANTGVGKTMLLQNMALHTTLPTLLFELELPGTLTFERFVGMALNMTGGAVLDNYRAGNTPDWRGSQKLDHINVCSEAKLTTADIERIIRQTGLKTGVRPVLVLLDYIQLMKGKGDRYERLSDVAEELKVIAKQTATVIVIASQISRRDKKSAGDDKALEVTMHDAKDSGSIENSSGLVIGAWKHSQREMWLKICKNTKGFAGKKVLCRIREGSMRIEQHENQPQEDAV